MGGDGPGAETGDSGWTRRGLPRFTLTWGSLPPQELHRWAKETQPCRETAGPNDSDRVGTRDVY